MMMRVLSLILLCCVVLYVRANDDTSYAAYQVGSGEWSVVEAKRAPKDKAVATATYTNSMNETGWATLNIQTVSGHEDEDQAYSAGFIEGYLTADLIYKWFVNTKICEGDVPEPVKPWLVQNYEWIQSQIAACKNQHTSDCAYWYQVDLLLIQLRGMVDGYNNATSADKTLSHMDFFARNAFDEWDDIWSGINVTNGDLTPPTPTQALFNSHCSVLVKATEDLKHLYASHVTWGSFCNMMRIFKNIKLNFKEGASVISFSSFPAALVSGDDYYTTDKGLVVTETTNDVYNMSLFRNINIKTVPFWIRVSIANRIADSGKVWTSIFTLYNSGTYNNQWQVVDMKVFKGDGSPLQAGLLWIAEQIPGYVVSADVTNDIVQNGYFPSYNIPYFPFVYNISGYPAMYAQYGNAYSHTSCPRANIFRRDQGEIKTLDDFKSMMRYNDYKDDPLSLGNACNGISARCDLNKGTGMAAGAFGGYDCKVTDNELIATMTTHALSGPSNVYLPSFDWSNWMNISHIAQPEVFDFPFIEITPDF